MVPEKVGELVWLEELILSKQWYEYDFESQLVTVRKSQNTHEPNKIKLLSSSLCHLRQLKKLVIQSSLIADLGPITKLINLGNFYCDSTPVCDLTPLKGLANLKVISCSKTRITDISPLSSLTNLQEFYCDATKVFDLTPLSYLVNLKQLRCNATKISDLSPLVGLTNLERLYCSGTQVLDLSPLANLLNLQHLSFCETQVNNLSPLASLIRLQELSCRETQVADLLPISKLVNLSEFDCFISKVSDLSPLKQLINLKVLYCGNTQVSDLSPILGFIHQGIQVEMYGYVKKGHRFDFLDCPLIHPPPEIVKQGNDAILNYFAEREKAQFKNTEIKLIIVGNSTVGKTSLSRFLRERTCQSGETTTHGIRNDRWQPDGSNLQVNLWDFGGQEYYHATHQLFLSRNSVYVLLWDKKTDKGGYCETPIYFNNDLQPTILQLEHFPQKWWLQNIRHYTKESIPPVPILLVQNKSYRDGIGRVSESFEKPPYNLMSEWLDNHIDLEAAANLGHTQHKKWLRQFETFEERLLDKLQSQLANYEFAVYHREIRDEVRRLASEGVNDLPYSNFEALCRRFDPDAKMDLVQIYLRDITGDILYYPNNMRLKERVFLRPNWVCDSIYNILSRKVQEHEGVFDKVWVQQALKCDEKNALDFVELLREFELVFDDTNESGQSTGQLVAPQYLSENCTKPEKLEAVKEYSNLTHAFTIWFHEFLPKSYIGRFVANWGSRAKQRLFWKNGLLFQTEGCTALVERTEGNKIRVEVQANQPNRQKAIRQILQSFIRLEDGLAEFALSLDGQTFVLWRDLLEAIQSQAKQVKTFPYTNPITLEELNPFFIFHQPLMPLPKKVFISYSKTDKAYLEQLKKHLAPLRRQGLLETWDDMELIAGEPWDAAIHQQLSSADIIILLVSADFMATDYVWDIEINKAIERHERGEVTVIPIIIRPSLWQDAPFAYLTAIPEKGKAISTWDNSDEAWAHVGEKIKQVAQQ